MEFSATSVVPHRLARVYRAYRDELPAIAAYMPNVKRVEVLRADPIEGGVTLHNVWTGKGEIPRLAQGVIKPEFLVWDDYATWHDATTHCEWRIGIRVFTDKFSCHGTNHLAAQGAHTTVTLRGTLTLDTRDIPGVPRVVAAKLQPQIESFIVKLIRPNLEQTNLALGRYLSEHAG